jgi:hypothetical protein
MKRYTIIFLLIITAIKSSAQQHVFQGKYNISYGKTQESPYKLLEIFYKSIDTAFFYMEVGRGAPDYNSGAMYAEMVLDKRTGHMYYSPADTINDCTLEFIKKGNSIIVNTLHGDCPFGYGVGADGIYKLSDNKAPKSFIDRHGHKIFFNKTTPKQYLE